MARKWTQAWMMSWHQAAAKPQLDHVRNNQAVGLLFLASHCCFQFVMMFYFILFLKDNQFQSCASFIHRTYQFSVLVLLYSVQGFKPVFFSSRDGENCSHNRSGWSVANTDKTKDYDSCTSYIFRFFLKDDK